MFQLQYGRCATWSKINNMTHEIIIGSYFNTSEKKKAHKTLVMYSNVSWNVFLLFHSFIDSFSDSFGLIHFVI